jgi:hypothetical protein
VNAGVMPLEAAIARSRRWMVASNALIDGRTFETSDRTRVAVALLHLSTEHQKGIHTLVDMGVLGSAFALLRPQMESFVRGAWYFHCATDEQISAFINGGEPPHFSQLNRDLQTKVLGFEKGIEEAVTRDGWRALCDFTHGGSIQVKARVTRDEITLNFKAPHIINLLDTSISLSLLAGAQLGTIAKDDKLATDLHEAYKSLNEQAA